MLNGDTKHAVRCGLEFLITNHADRLEVTAVANTDLLPVIVTKPRPKQHPNGAALALVKFQSTYPELTAARALASSLALQIAADIAQQMNRVVKAARPVDKDPNWPPKGVRPLKK